MLKRKDLKLIKVGTGEEAVLKQCTVQPNLIHSKDIKTPVEKGDILEHPLPSGLLEKYLVKRVDAFTNTLPHYELQVERID